MTSIASRFGISGLVAAALLTACGYGADIESVDDQAQAQTAALNPIADATVRSGRNASANYGAASVLDAVLGSEIQQSYLKFRVALPAGSTVSSARLRCYATGNGGSANGPAVYATDLAWSEATLTWNNKPAQRALLANVGAAASKSWVEWDVTAAVTGGEVSFALVAESSDRFSCNSKEASVNKPQLVVSYTEAPVVTPDAGTVDAGSAPVDAGTPDAGSGTVDAGTSVVAATLAPSADTTAKENAPSDNFGSATTLTADYYDSSLGGRDYLYLKFDVAVPAGSVVTSAKLRCFVTNAAPSALPTVSRTAADWTEGGLTWANKPALVGASIGTFPGSSANAWAELDVTSAVTASGAYSFVMTPPATDDGMVCNSREATTNRPQLVLAFATGSPPPPPPPPATTGIVCPADFGTELFRDDFNGTAVDTTKWNVIEQNTGGGEFTQLTKMLRENVSVSGGTLKLASRRHCTDPYPNSAAEHPEQCGGTNYYSGAWMKATRGYAPGKGLMVYHAKFPTPVRGSFPALWARNTRDGSNGNYLEMDLIEQWWDSGVKGVAANTDMFSVTTHLDTTTQGWNKTRNNNVGPFANLVERFHVWEVEWNATVSPAYIKYYYRDAPGSARQLLRTVYSTSTWDSGVSETEFADGIRDAGCTTNCGIRPYVDFAVQPDGYWHVGPDSASVYDPGDLEVDSVIVCKP